MGIPEYDKLFSAPLSDKPTFEELCAKLLPKYSVRPSGMISKTCREVFEIGESWVYPQKKGRGSGEIEEITGFAIFYIVEIYDPVTP